MSAERSAPLAERARRAIVRAATPRTPRKLTVRVAAGAAERAQELEVGAQRRLHLPRCEIEPEAKPPRELDVVTG